MLAKWDRYRSNIGRSFPTFFELTFEPLPSRLEAISLRCSSSLIFQSSSSVWGRVIEFNFVKPYSLNNFFDVFRSLSKMYSLVYVFPRIVIQRYVLFWMEGIVPTVLRRILEVCWVLGGGRFSA